MKKTYFVTAASTVVAMAILMIFAIEINFILYLLLCIFPIIISALFIRKFSTSNKISSSWKLALSNAIIYVLIFAVMSFWFGKMGGYEILYSNSVTSSNLVGLATPEKITISDLFLPFGISFTCLYLAVSRGDINE